MISTSITSAMIKLAPQRDIVRMSTVLIMMAWKNMMMGAAVIFNKLTIINNLHGRYSASSIANPILLK